MDIFIWVMQKVSVLILELPRNLTGFATLGLMTQIHPRKRQNMPGDPTGCKWLGFDWEERLFHASDYFDQLYEWATQLIKEGKAFVCDLTFEEMRKFRGTLTEPGRTVHSAIEPSKTTLIFLNG